MKRAPLDPRAPSANSLTDTDEVFVVMVQRLSQLPGRIGMDHLVDPDLQAALVVELDPRLKFVVARHAGAVDGGEPAGHGQRGTIHQVPVPLLPGEGGKVRDEAGQLGRRPLHELPGGLPVLVLLDVSTFGIGRVPGDPGELQSFAVRPATVCVSADVHRIVRGGGVQEFLSEHRRVPNGRHPAAQHDPPGLRPRTHPFARLEGMPDHLLHVFHRGPLTDPRSDVGNLGIQLPSPRTGCGHGHREGPG